MGISQAKLLTELREHTGVDEDDLSNDDALLLLNRAWWNILNKVEFHEKDRDVPIQTSVGLRKISLPTNIPTEVFFEALVGLSIREDENSEFKRLTKIENWEADNRFSEAEDARGLPEAYTRYRDKIVLYPTPDEVYDMRLRYTVTLADLENTNDAPDVPSEWHEQILLGAIKRTFLRFGDYNRLSAVSNFQSAEFNALEPIKSKEREDLHEARIEIQGYDDVQNGRYV